MQTLHHSCNRESSAKYLLQRFINCWVGQRMECCCFGFRTPTKYFKFVVEAKVDVFLSCCKPYLYQLLLCQLKFRILAMQL